MLAAAWLKRSPPLLLLGIAWILAACRPISQASFISTSVAAPTAILPSDYTVLAWVDNPTPNRDEQVIVMGSLLNGTVSLGGMMMQAYWPDPQHEPGIPNCFVLVTYGRGVCTLDASSFPFGEPVTVEVRFNYRDHTYTGQVIFTPQ